MAYVATGAFGPIDVQEPMGYLVMRTIRGSEIDRLNHVKAELLTTYGKRTDFVGPSGKIVPYLPVSYAENLYRDYRGVRDMWLDSSKHHLPSSIVEPTLIKRLVANLFGILYEIGGVQGAKLRADSLEAGPHGGIVLKAQQTYDFLDNATRLAIHVDSIYGSGARSRTQDILDAAEQATVDAVKTVFVDPIHKLADKFKIPRWVTWVSVGFGGLYVYNTLKTRSRR